MAANYILKLYVTGQTANSQKAIETLKSVLEAELKGLYSLDVINVLKYPNLAEEDKILATPTLMKVLPPPVRKIIGDLSDKEKVLLGLGLSIEKKERVSEV
jgi:circadian clock protein KaiB